MRPAFCTCPTQIDSVRQDCILRRLQPKARWQSGYAAACKAVYAGSIPTLASIHFLRRARVAELVDAADLKSAVRNERAGSSPALGTTTRPRNRALVVLRALVNPVFDGLNLLFR